MHGVESARRLEAHLYAGLLVILLDGVAHHVGSFGSGSRLLLAGARLDVVGAGVHGQQAGLLDVGGRGEQSCLQDNLQLALATHGLQLAYLVTYGLVVAAQEGAHAHHHVYLGGSVLECEGGLGHLHLDESL